MSSAEAREAHQPESGAIDLTVLRAPESGAARAYRSVRASVRYARRDEPVRSLYVAESGVGDRPGEAAANIAASFALNGDSTVLVDLDLFHPVQHRYLNVPEFPGTIEWLLANEASLRTPPHETALEGLRVLPAGDLELKRQRPGVDLLGADRCRELIEDLKQDARFVVFHASTLPDSSEGLTLAALTDAVLMVIRSGVTKRTDAQRARAALERVHARVLGAVLTGAR